MIGQGVPPKKIQTILGHCSIAEDRPMVAEFV
jgi:hypothetical protein